MIPVAKPRDRERLLYDRSLLEELSNISSRRNDGNYRENLVHYVVSGRSTEAVTEIAGMLAQSLYRTERIVKTCAKPFMLWEGRNRDDL